MLIAEDYRVLFAPSPYNQEHQIATHTRTGVELPSEEVKEYISNLVYRGGATRSERKSRGLIGQNYNLRLGALHLDN